MRARSTVTLAALAALAAAGCSHYKRTCPVLPELPTATPSGESVELRFLGVGGFLLRYTAAGRTDTLLTAPLYSNPTFGEIASQGVNPDNRLIDALLPREADQARAVFVGHGHYDHLMDVPWLVEQRAKGATIYGNQATFDVLQTIQAVKHRVVSLQHLANQPCDWIGGCQEGHAPWKPYHVPGMRLRVWSILSEHSAQFVLPGALKLLFPHPVHLWRGEPLEPATTPPKRPSDWPEGTTLAYVFDFMRDGAGSDDAWNSPAVAFRAYYQDSAARAPFGVPPPLARPSGQAGVDLALLCVGGSKQVPGEPKLILTSLKPRFAVGSHWEDFFNPRQLQAPRPKGEPREPAFESFSGVISGADPVAFEKSMKTTLKEGAEYVMACPDAITRFVRGADGAWNRAVSSERWHRATGR